MEKFDLQNEFLTPLMEKKLPVRVITTNGFQMTGRILGFDKYVIVLYVDGARQMIYKSAVSTIQEGA